MGISGRGGFRPGAVGKRENSPAYFGADSAPHLLWSVMTRFTSPSNRRSAAADDNSWIKSTFSNGSCTCVEVRPTGDSISLRDSKFVASHRFHRQLTIEVPAAAWPGFLDDVVGRPRPSANRAVAIRAGADGGVSIRCSTTGTTLWFNSLEWRAFTRGVMAGEFSFRLAA